jgi:putative isomerase
VGYLAAERPAEFTHLNSGITITPVLYSDRAQSATDLPPGAQIRYGHRGIGDGRIEFTSLFEDTQLDWLCDRHHGDVQLSWACKSNGEWGLRYWVCLCLSGPPGVSISYDPDNGTAKVQHSNHSMHIDFTSKPLLVTAHNDVQGLRDEFAHKGYFYLNSRCNSGSVLAFRFNLDETPALSVRVSSQATHSVDRSKIKTTHASSSSDLSHPQQALQAIHDVLAWNHVFDPVNKRPYTALTRNWSQKKFGGFGVWLNDNLFHGLMWAMLKTDKAQHNIEAVFANQTTAGNFPCLVTGNDAWLDRSQIPMASYVVRAIYRATNDLDWLKYAYPRLLANHQWWWQNRLLPELGLVAYGSSPNVGDGLYKGTRLGARNESAMDNMAVHDEAAFDPHTGLLQSADVGLNSLLALDGEVLAQIARMLGNTRDANALTEQTEHHKQRVQAWLWDSGRAVFANRLRNGKFVDALAPTSFFPMVAGIATDAQAKSMIELYLQPPEKFGGRYALPSAPRDHPAYQDNSYWRGRVWAPLNYWVYRGLERYEYTHEARLLAEKSREMFSTHWVHRQCGENYSAVTGDINDQPDTDSFYTWGALLPTLSVLQIVSDTHWGGLTITPEQHTGTFGPVLTNIGKLEITTHATDWTVTVNDKPWISGSGAVSFGTIERGDNRFTATVKTGDKQVLLRFHNRAPDRVRVDEQLLAARDDSYTLSEALNGQLLEALFT